jgi:hypothetical protein
VACRLPLADDIADRAVFLKEDGFIFVPLRFAIMAVDILRLF